MSKKKKYDQSLKELLSNPIMVKSLLLDIIKEPWTGTLKLEKFTLMDKEFPNLKNGRLESDLIYRFEYKNQIGYLFLLLEFQKTPEDISFRILEYMNRIYRFQKKKHKTIHPVIPVVFYHGDRRWKEKPDFHSHFKFIDSDLKKYTPSFKYILINIENFTDSITSDSPPFEKMTGILKAEFSDPEQILKFIPSVIEPLALSNPEEFSILAKLIYGLFTSSNVELKMRIEDLLEEKTHMRFVDSLMELEERGHKKGLKEGRSKGLKEGRSKGLKEGQKNYLQHLIQLKSDSNDIDFSPVQNCNSIDLLREATDRLALGSTVTEVLDFLKQN